MAKKTHPSKHNSLALAISRLNSSWPLSSEGQQEWGRVGGEGWNLTEGEIWAREEGGVTFLKGALP